MDVLAPLAAPGVLAETAALGEALRRAQEAADALRQKLHGSAELTALGPRIGMLGSLPDTVAHAEDYHRALSELTGRWQRFEEDHKARLDAGRRQVAAAFRDDEALREVLLLSNDSHFPRFAAWLDQDVQRFGRTDRRTADLLVRYLQRVATKNETTSHFGPVATGRLSSAANGMRWREAGAPQRRVHCAHWAAETVARTLSARPELRELIRPRRRPLVFHHEGHVQVYAPTTTTGFLADWRFERVADTDVTPAQAWLLDGCDGERSLRALRREWPYGTEDGGLDAVLADLAAKDWIVDRFEIPVGTAEPLTALHTALPPAGHSPAADQAHEAIRSLERRLAEFQAAAPALRPAALAAARQEFTALTGAEANRNAGRHYADRAIFYEECHSRVDALRAGPDVGRLLGEELAPVLDLVLAGARLRVRRERQILAEWAAARFGTDTRVPLSAFYTGFFTDRDQLVARCADVDAEVAAWDDAVTDALLSGTSAGATEIEVPLERLVELAARRPDDPAVVCNPDVLLAARSAADIAEGRFLAVLGECHAVRELLCHSSYAPLLAEKEPDLARLVHEAYADLVGPEEILCDLVRSHPNKTGAQLLLPVPDVEITGRSGKPRDQVLRPEQLYVVVRDGRVELRADGVDRRLRPLSVPAGGQSLRQDPLAPLGFPRHYGGVTLRSRNHDHVPRIRCGRIVLRRASWRVPVEALRGTRPFAGRGDADAADFHALQGLRERLGLPRHVFAKVPGEPKPLYLDLDSPLLAREVCRAARGASGSVELSEMLPGPDQLWLDLDGRGHTAELRCALFSPAESA
ncbi:lantibiotic dehydratase [Streptomyces sp. NPDC127084]|uniref:lantibiotic dehydratase n=1 Tax=Streptomyces sp. NPDC127084 TaxID=3347133 RepID=UPI00364869C8